MRSSLKGFLFLVISFVIGIFFSFAPSTIFAAGVFTPTERMDVGRSSHTSTLLGNGKVLVAGGNQYDHESELYDPATGLFSPTGSLVNSNEGFATATVLGDGRVLMAGGININGHTTNVSEIYDPVTGTFSVTGNLNYDRASHTATLLNNGKVLIVGGDRDRHEEGVNVAELYDPTTGTFSTTGTLNFNRANHTASLLPDGKVLIWGGRPPNFPLPFPGVNAETYDPATGVFTLAPVLLDPNRYDHTATTLSNGKILIAGGEDSNGFTASAELYDPVTGTSSFVGNMITPRAFHTASLLQNGKVLVAGGSGLGQDTSAELYNPTTQQFEATGTMNFSHQYHTATTMANGKVLITGSYTDGTSAEVYDPNGVAGPVINLPPTKDACKDGGYVNFTDDLGNPFPNQGQCVSFTNHH